MMSGTAYVGWHYCIFSNSNKGGERQPHIKVSQEESREYFLALKFILTALCAQILRLSTASTEEAFLKRGYSE